MSNKKNKLTLSTLNKFDSELNEKKSILILGEHQHLISKTFRKSDIQHLLVDYLMLVQDLHNLENVEAKTILDGTSLLHVLIVKYFTDIEIPPVKDLISLIQVAKVLLDKGIMDELFDGDKGFHESQIKEISDSVNKVSKKMNDNFEQMMLSNPESIIDEIGEINGGTQESQ